MSGRALSQRSLLLLRPRSRSSAWALPAPPSAAMDAFNKAVLEFHAAVDRKEYTSTPALLKAVREKVDAFYAKMDAQYMEYPRMRRQLLEFLPAVESNSHLTEGQKALRTTQILQMVEDLDKDMRDHVQQKALIQEMYDHMENRLNDAVRRLHEQS